MNATRPPRGAAPVGHLTELTGIEAAAVIYLRLWCEGPHKQIEVWSDFRRTLGSHRAEHACQAFQELCSICCTKGRRPLMRHSIECRCLGGDEACFANLVATAAEGEREDALLMATLIVEPSVAQPLTTLATQVGLAFKQMQLSSPAGLAEERPRLVTLH